MALSNALVLLSLEVFIEIFSVFISEGLLFDFFDTIACSINLITLVRSSLLAGFFKAFLIYLKAENLSLAFA